MSEYPEDIMKTAEAEVSEFVAWIECGNTTASLSEHAANGLRDSFASALLAERKRCAEGEFQALRGAFLRGAEWCRENGNDAEYAVKAANDYADYNTAIATGKGDAA